LQNRENSRQNRWFCQIHFFSFAKFIFFQNPNKLLTRTRSDDRLYESGVSQPKMGTKKAVFPSQKWERKKRCFPAKNGNEKRADIPPIFFRGKQ
jgi:hypothetical protein